MTEQQIQKAKHQAQLASLLWLQQELTRGMSAYDMRKVVERHIERLHAALDITPIENGSQD